MLQEIKEQKQLVIDLGYRNVIQILKTNIYLKVEYYKNLFSFQHKNFKVNPFVHSS